MPASRAVLLIDHHSAQLMRLDGAEHTAPQRIQAHNHNTKQHGSDVRAEHEFFGHVCDALAAVSEVLVAGSHQSQADFRHYVEKHRAETVRRIVGWQTVDHPTPGQLLAKAKEFFVQHDVFAKGPTTPV